VPKKSITLPSHVLKVAEEEAVKFYNGKLSAYVQELIKRDKSSEIDMAFIDMPVRASKAISARIENQCRFCSKVIRVGDKICNARFSDNHEQYVHEKCCKD
jgi:hypothetical protein